MASIIKRQDWSINILHTKNEQGKTPLHIACSVSSTYSVKQLVKATKSFSTITNEDQLPLQLAIESGNLEVVKIFLAEDVEVFENDIKCAVRCVEKNKFDTL